MHGLVASLLVEPPCRGWLPTKRPNSSRHRASGSRCLAVQSGSGGSGGNEPDLQRPQGHGQRQLATWQQHVGDISRRGAVAMAAAALAATAVLTPPLAAPPAADAVTQEQLLFLEAWRAVDRAYVDKKFNGQNWFKARMRLSTSPPCPSPRLLACYRPAAVPPPGLLTPLPCDGHRTCGVKYSGHATWMLHPDWQATSGLVTLTGGAQPHKGTGSIA